tara:strand:- start:75 stop:260 length:186 start_codon:yes stop_codon:yes gene_type:complete
MSTWWEKQEGLKELAKQFRKSQNKYIIGKRHSPTPPMSPFGSEPKESDGEQMTDVIGQADT